MDSIKKVFYEDIKQKSKARPRQAVAKKKPKKIIMPFELNKEDAAYRPGEVFISQLPKCPTCGEYFEKTDPKQKYCSHRCMETMRMRNKRLRRINKGLCSHTDEPKHRFP